MNILYITAYPLEYNTSGNVRNMSIIKGLVNNGHQVSTMSPYPTDTSLFSGKLIVFPFKQRYWLGSKEPAVNIQPTNGLLMWVKCKLYKLNNAISVYDRRSSYTKYVKDLNIDQQFDIIISSSDPKSAHLFAEEYLKRDNNKGIRWIQYWGDPFTGDISNKHSFSEGKIRKEEKRLLGIADKVIYVSPLTAEAMKVSYPEHSSKIAFLPIPYIESAKEEKRDTNKLVAYLGDYNSHNRNILPFVEAVNRLGIETAIVGGSDLKIDGNDHLTVKGRMTGDELKRITSQVGVYICICNLYGTQIPGKIYHYANSPYPILIILDGENKELLRDYFASFDRFYLCDNTVDSIVECLQIIRQENKSFVAPEKLSPSYLANEFVK